MPGRVASIAAAALYRNFRVYQVFGANTDVGKTVFSTLLCRTAARSIPSGDRVWYLKPVSTGALSDADKSHLDRHAPGTVTQNFYQFDDAVSPHIAAGTTLVDDTDLVSRLAKQVAENARAGPGLMLVETAGGPHSPAPSGTSQADLLRPLRLPTLFVADYRLGGISTSISSFEALRLRGLDVEGVAVCKDDVYQNHQYLTEYFARHDIPTLTMPLPPPQTKNEDPAVMSDFYAAAEEGVAGGVSLAEFNETLQDRHERRLERLQGMPSAAMDKMWWPFQQHQLLRPEKLNVIDSAYGDYFQTLSRDADAGSAGEKGSSLLTPTVDGSASWWTQGLGHANPDLAATAAYAAGRYGHVMFAEGVHEPALCVAERLLAALQNKRLQRVFFSDNGSTGIEVGMKMALKGAAARYGWADEDTVEIIGLNNSYHGDTMGAMDMSEPGVYNKKVHWYSGRGFWFDTPSVQMRDGVWRVDKPGADMGPDRTFASLAAVFDPARDGEEDAVAYETYIRKTLERLTRDEKRKFGALIMEPVVLGAGGMILVDPQFQRAVVNVVRNSTDLFSLGKSSSSTSIDATEWQGLPVVFDEVFTGLYRLGHSTAASLLRLEPDVSVHAKLLTGGLLPLACTVASESLFKAALSPSKTDALLHGHSYTAHPVGCAVAVESMRQLSAQDSSGAWDAFKADWAGTKSVGAELLGAMRDLAKGMAPGSDESTEQRMPWSVWSRGFVGKLTRTGDKVDGAWALGSVLAVALHDAGGAGYTSDAARVVQQALLERTAGGWRIHSRVLGNVLYLMTSQTTTEDEVRKWERRVLEAIESS